MSEHTKMTTPRRAYVAEAVVAPDIDDTLVSCPGNSPGQTRKIIFDKSKAYAVPPVFLTTITDFYCIAKWDR